MTDNETANAPPDGHDQSTELRGMGKFHMGERLQAIRRCQGLSQRELAKKAGITNGSLSLIEQGKVSPSFHSLEKIIAAIPMTLIEFFDETYQPLAPVVKIQDQEQVGHKEVIITALSLEFMGLPGSRLADHRLEAGAEYRFNRPVVAGFLCGKLMSGKLQLELNGATHDILAGEFFRFDLRQEHRLINVGTTCSRAVILICSDQGM